MEALVPALIAAIVTQLGDRAPWLTAILADRFGRPLAVALAAGIAHAAGNTVAALGGMWVAPMLTPRAWSVLLAVAFAFATFDMLRPVRAPDRLDGWRMGSVLTPLFGIGILAAGNTAQLFTFAIAARSLPWFAAAGATLGCFAVAFVAAVLGEQLWRRARFGAWRILVGVLFALAGAVTGLGAAGLI
ncbi:MAG: TMEM165/GDT1 family protein [Pseudomonadota bacterium]